MNDKEWMELEIDYIVFTLDQVKQTCDNPKFKKDNVKRIREVEVKLSNLKMMVA